MEWLQVLILAAIQGITEFLPISSSGHLVLPSVLLGWPDQGLAFDVAVHLGSLTAVILYFRADIRRLLEAWLWSLRGRHSDDSRLAWLVALATLPAAVAGLMLGDFIEAELRGVAVLAATTLGFGVLLGVADWLGTRRLELPQMGIGGALLIGCAQALALIPGTSRSGITITAALLLGFAREPAARFSFLLAIPIILAAGVLKGAELGAGPTVPWAQLAVATLVSAVTAFSCIHLFLRALERIGMWPFVIYRLLLGALLAVIAAGAV